MPNAQWPESRELQRPSLNPLPLVCCGLDTSLPAGPQFPHLDVGRLVRILRKHQSLPSCCLCARTLHRRLTSGVSAWGQEADL